MANKVVIIGATSAIAERCARIWVRDARLMVLVGRDLEKLERVAADLRVRAPSATLSSVVADFVDPPGIRALVDRMVADGAPDLVLIAHGSLPDQAACESDLVACDDALVVNGVSPALFAEAFVGPMRAAGRGSLIVIGSVAGDRGRKSNYVYGAAKGMVERYVQGLQHRLAGSGVVVTLVKPGPTDTPMTAHLKNQGMRLADADEVAARIVDGAAHGRPVVHAPGKWALIMLVIRHLPRFVFNRMDI